MIYKDSLFSFLHLSFLPSSSIPSTPLCVAGVSCLPVPLCVWTQWGREECDSAGSHQRLAGKHAAPPHTRTRTHIHMQACMYSHTHKHACTRTHNTHICIYVQSHRCDVCWAQFMFITYCIFVYFVYYTTVHIHITYEYTMYVCIPLY